MSVAPDTVARPAAPFSAPTISVSSENENFISVSPVVLITSVFESVSSYDAASAGVDRDLRTRIGPMEPVLARLDPRLASPTFLRAEEFADLVAFVRTGLLDRRALPQHLCSLTPASLPSGMPPLRFEACPQTR